MVTVTEITLPDEALGYIVGFFFFFSSQFNKCIEHLLLARHGGGQFPENLRPKALPGIKGWEREDMVTKDSSLIHLHEKREKIQPLR